MLQRFNGWAILLGLTDFLSSYILKRLSDSNIHIVYSTVFCLMLFFPAINIVGRGFIDKEKRESLNSLGTFLGSIIFTSFAVAIFFTGLFCDFINIEIPWLSFIMILVVFFVFVISNSLSMKLPLRSFYQIYVKAFIVFIFYLVISSIQLLIDYYYQNLFRPMQIDIISNMEVHLIGKFFIVTSWIIIFTILAWISTWMFRNNLNLILYSSVIKGKDYFITILLSYTLKVIAA